jgi:hypothetical protein
MGIPLKPPNPVTREVRAEEGAILEAAAEVIRCLQAAMWDSYYGKGIALGYAQNRDVQARMMLARLEHEIQRGEVAGKAKRGSR